MLRKISNGPAPARHLPEWAPASGPAALDRRAFLQRSGVGPATLLRRHGFEVLDLLELQAPEGGDPGQWDFVTPEWARRWPSEELWAARKRS